MRATDVVRLIAKQSALIAQREARRGQTAQRLFGLFRLDNEGEISHQIRSKPYTYEIVSDALIPLGIHQQIAKSEFNVIPPLLTDF